ncbi:MAG TPA: VWA domain-containing protein [Candidatus Omnitrophota bacterium]|nr:VWA domain-containing protein [Candidatus Omnitrophota bacterium]
MQFFKPEFFFYLWLVPAVFAIYVLSRKLWHKKLGTLIRDKALLSKLIEGYRRAEWLTRSVLITLAVFLMVLSLARPQWGDEKRNIQRKGVDMVFLVDASLSMLAEDIKPNRLEKAKFEIDTFTKNLGGDRIGMVTFAGSGFLQSPLTLDHSAFLLFLDAVQVGFLPDPGTSLAQAIHLAIKAFPQKELKYKAIVLFTDGEDHDGGIEKALEEAKQAGVRIYTIGMGSPEGEPIPLKDQKGQRTGFKKDRGGQMVLTKLNQPLLEKIAKETGGLYLRATPGEKEVEIVIRHLKSWGEQKFEEKTVVEREDQYQVFLVLAFLLLIAEMLLRRRDRRKTPQILACFAAFLLFSGFLGTSQDAVKKGNESFRDKRYQSAIESYRKVQVKNPDAPEVLYDLGTALYKTDSFQESAKDLEDAAKKAGEPALKAKALYNHGNALYRLGDFEKAIDAYKKALEIDPADKDAKYNLEFLQKKKNDMEKKDQQRKNDKQDKNKEQQQDQQNQQDKQDKGQQKQDQKNQGQGQQDQKQSSQQDQQQKDQQQQNQQNQQQQQNQPKDQQDQQQQKQQQDQNQQQESQKQEDQNKQDSGQQQDPQKKEEQDRQSQQEREQQQKEQEERDRQEQERLQQEKQKDEQEKKQGQAKQPLQGQMSMENALNLLDALKESEKELQDLRRPPVDKNPPSVDKDW